MDKEERDQKLRLIEMLLLITSILFGIGNVKNSFLFYFFLIFAIFYYIAVSWQVKFTLVLILTAMAFSGIFVLGLGTTLSNYLSSWQLFSVIFLYFLVMTMLVFVALNSKNGNKEFKKQVISLKRKIIKSK